LLERLRSAVNDGRLDELESLLAADVVAYSDGGGKAGAARLPVAGRDKVIRFMANLVRRFGPSPYLRILEVNGGPAAQFSLGGQDALVALEVRDGRVQSILTMLNPDKLSYFYRQTAGVGDQAASE
jgi:RNA polymerase sigma-70 factor (ECF subfamily)